MHKKNPFKYIYIVLSSILLVSCGSHSIADERNQLANSKLVVVPVNKKYHKSRTTNNFNDYVNFLKGKALSEGVSRKTINNIGFISYDDSILRIDMKQKGISKAPRPQRPNPHGVTNYINKVLNNRKLELAIDNYHDYASALKMASRKTGVQEKVIVALWGLESAFGTHQGSYDVLSVLATLAFEGRRENLFSREFISALKILDKGHISRSNMKGSWAGAMGQSQFMPTSYLKYAVDFDGDGKKDIWNTKSDVFGSIGNYLATIGWNKNIPWGVEVSVTKHLSTKFDGTKKAGKTLKEWSNLGIRLKNNNIQDQNKYNQLRKSQLWLIRPNKEVGRAFLVTSNYKTILHWNNSNYFAISVGTFVDRIALRIRQ